MKKRIHLTFILPLLMALTLISACQIDPPREIPPTSAYGSGAFANTDEDDTNLTPPRPDNAVFMLPGHCGCEGTTPITLGNCANFCASQSNENETLYLSVQVNEQIEFSELEDFHGWCTKDLTFLNPETEEIEAYEVSPSCSMVATDEDNNSLSLNFTPREGSTRFDVDITLLEFDKTYRLQIVETVSGAKSNIIQMRKVSQQLEPRAQGALWPSPVYQYTCITRQLDNDDLGFAFYLSAQRSHFYFVDETRPEPLPEAYPNIYCHDFLQPGVGSVPINNPLLEETPGHFYVWSKDDPRFFDLNQNQVLDINDLITQEANNLGAGLSAPSTIFAELTYPNGPTLENVDSSNGQKKLGYYMTTFIDDQTNKAYCPNSEHYYGSNPLFAAMRELVGVDTEGIYFAKQDNVCDFILIRESLLRQIWFYMENGVPIEPNSDTVRGKQIQFYWPPDIASPFIKKSNQRVYTVKAQDDLGCAQTSVNQNDNGSGLRDSLPAHDKRFGCVPELSTSWIP